MAIDHDRKTDRLMRFQKTYKFKIGGNEVEELVHTIALDYVSMKGGLDKTPLTASCALCPHAIYMRVSGGLKVACEKQACAVFYDDTKTVLKEKISILPIICSHNPHDLSKRFPISDEDENDVNKKAA